ncbi:hypothetical protein HQ544_01635 [Candidatus Falkowbacteria bacterium]|nr:hypothetical protein [Candidatus Falkowbacteria bacterium]
MDIPPEIQIKSTIREGSIFYFTEESFNVDTPHYFVTLNHTPLKDEFLILVCAVTFDTKVYERIDRKMKCLSSPKETFVDVKDEECVVLKKLTLFDCNIVIEKDVDTLVDKLSKGKLKMPGYIESDILKRLKNGVMKSPQVEIKIKKMLNFNG